MMNDVLLALTGRNLNVDELKAVKAKVSEWLINGKDSGTISNDFYLMSGKIEGGLDVIIAMVENNAPEEEIRIHTDSVVARIESISL